jgi:GTP-binding protein EngB required for normal cell division
MISIMSTKNIVLFGQSGAGKSSVVNLIAGQMKAKTSPGTERCTMHWEEHLIEFDGCTYKMFDTIGLEDPQLAIEEYLDAIVNAYSLITNLKDAGGIDLLVFCVRAGRFTSAIQSNYRLFYEWLCEKKVPIVLVLTGLEREKNMEDWWTKYKFTFDKYGIFVDGHACITAASGLEGKHQLLYEESRRLIHDLVRKHVHGGGAYTGGEAWYRRVIQKMWQLTAGKLKFTQRRKDITVLTKRCGMPPHAAKELASKIRTDLGGTSSSLK